MNIQKSLGRLLYLGALPLLLISCGDDRQQKGRSQEMDLSTKLQQMADELGRGVEHDLALGRFTDSKNAAQTHFLLLAKEYNVAPNELILEVYEADENDAFGNRMYVVNIRQKENTKQFGSALFFENSPNRPAVLFDTKSGSSEKLHPTISNVANYIVAAWYIELCGNEESRSLPISIEHLSEYGRSVMPSFVKTFEAREIPGGLIVKVNDEEPGFKYFLVEHAGAMYDNKIFTLKRK